MGYDEKERRRDKWNKKKNDHNNFKKKASNKNARGFQREDNDDEYIMVDWEHQNR